MKLRLLTIATVLMASTSLAQAAWRSEDIAREYAEQGYTRVEIDISSTHAKVEAIKGLEKLEVIYDLATGAVLKSELEAVDGDDDVAPGVFVRERDEDWFDDDDFDDDEDDDQDDDQDDDDDDDQDDEDDYEDHGGHHDDDDDDLDEEDDDEDDYEDEYEDDEDHGGHHDDDDDD